MKARILLFLAAIFILPRPSHAIVDLNQDGWSDLWQAMYGSGYVANADDDGDGRTNWEEHVEGTDPMDNLSKKGDSVGQPSLGNPIRSKSRLTVPLGRMRVRR
jgi:hypothetical protein